MKARLAWHDVEVNVTLRVGRDAAGERRGFIRVQGKTVSGTVWEGPSGPVFYPKGKHGDVPYQQAS